MKPSWFSHIRRSPAADRTHAGIVYASKAECRRARELDALKQAGAIRGWRRQVVFHLGCEENRYVADFVVTDARGREYVEEVKGFEDRRTRRIMRLWRRYGPMPLMMMKQSGRAWKSVRVVGGKQPTASFFAGM